MRKFPSREGLAHTSSLSDATSARSNVASLEPPSTCRGATATRTPLAGAASAWEQDTEQGILGLLDGCHRTWQPALPCAGLHLEEAACKGRSAQLSAHTHLTVVYLQLAQDCMPGNPSLRDLPAGELSTWGWLPEKPNQDVRRGAAAGA